jgi:hypothetical protein
VATTIERQEEQTERRPRLGWWTLGIAAVALVAMAISLVLVLAQAPAGTRAQQPGPADERVEAPAVAVPPTTLGPLWCEGELETVRAVEAGILPRETLDEEPYRTKLLIARGLIPRQAAEPCDT